MQRLIDAVRGLDPIERERIAAIRISTANGGYEVSIQLSMQLPEASSESLPEGVAAFGWEAAPALVRQLDWKQPIWDQIMELIHDSEMAQPHNLGSMEAAEAGTGETEKEKHWIVTTHGAPRSAERLEWLRRISTK